MRGDDQDESRRLSVNYEFSTGSGLQGNVLAFDTGAKTDQRTFEQRGLAPRPVAVDRRFQYSHDQSGIKGFAFQDFEWGDTNHRIGAGAEWIDTKIVEVRDGRQTSLIDGSVSNVILGQAMPVRDFPNSRSGQSGLWLEDTVNLANGRWQVTPAARWDRYDLDPKPDKLWREGNPDTHVVSLSEDRVTPRLGVLFRANQQWSLYGQYAKGFRAPPFEDANIGFDIPLFGFRAIPNPDLRSETSQGIELGVRRISSRARLSIALFRADYSDFIESRALIGRDPDSGDLIFQSRNIDRARVRGIDLRYDQDLGAWTKSLTGWTLKLAGYWAEGDDRQSGMPLNSIAPPQAILGLAWTSPDGSWDFDVNGTFTAAKSMSDIDTTDGPRFATPGWAAIDVTATWRPVDRLEIGLGVFNLADRTYWRWLDVSNLEADDPMIPLLSRPGRSVSAVVRISF
jgi:hemoglobin/transferrin/lactoferrin receptor protein